MVPVSIVKTHACYCRIHLDVSSPTYCAALHEPAKSALALTDVVSLISARTYTHLVLRSSRRAWKALYASTICGLAPT